MSSNHLLFEEDGAFKAATVLSGTDNALQVELASGKRTKVKASHVLLRYERPSPTQLLDQAQKLAAGIDLDFLWECAPQQEFGFLELGAEYFGRTPSAVEAAGLLLRLHGAPVYFHRKGRGRYKPAPPDVLKVALAAVARKRLQDEQRQQWVAALKSGTVPAPIAAIGLDLAVRPDRNSVEFKAVEQAAAELHTTPLRLLILRGAIASPYEWHVGAFQRTTFPRGTGFGAGLPPPPRGAGPGGDAGATGATGAAAATAPSAPLAPGAMRVYPAADALPVALTAAFSIDDSSTTEIDDAFSVTRLPAEGRVRVGIHIAAPALAIGRDDPLDAVARNRMSTVYAPGLKYTMLPEDWIDAFSLNEGRTVPVLSLLLEVDAASAEVLADRTVLERVRIDANLRHDRLDDLVTAERLDAATLPEVPHGADLAFLWVLAQRLLRAREQVRGKPEPVGRIDYGFVLDGEGASARVAIRPRRRGAPLDLIVAELMILANARWGGWLARERRVGIYRSQSRIDGINRVKMSTNPAPHDGIGVPQYAWSTSPLRRYVDLVNQRQLIAAALALPAPYAPQDADVYAIVSAFDAAYTGYADFQARMERYWCLRWLAQEGIAQVDGTVVRGDVVRIDGLPLVTRIPGLPDLPRGRRVRFDVLGHDEIELSLELRLREILADAPPQLDPEEEDEAVVAPTEPAPGGADGRAGAPFDDAAAEVEPTTPDPAADSALLDPADPTDATEVADETAGRPVPVGVPSLPRT